MNTKPILSIVIPTYNEEKAIETTVKQFASLKIPHEVIVSDSRSTDKTIEIATRCADKVIILAPEKKRSIAQGRNHGAAAAAGEYVAFLDADVVILNPTAFFTKALALFEENPKLVAVNPQIKALPEVALWSDKMVYGILNAQFAFFNNLFNFGMAGGEFLMIKTAAFRAVDGFNESIVASEDMDLFHRLAKIGRVRTAWGLVVFHPARRLHQEGWAPTVYRWIKNSISVWLFKKAADKEWEQVR